MPTTTQLASPPGLERRSLFWTGQVGFYAFFLTFFGAIDVHRVALAFMLICLGFWSIRFWTDWKHSPLTWLMLGGLVYLVTRYASAWLIAGSELNWHFDYRWPYLMLSILPLAIAPFLVRYRDETLLSRALILILIGFAIEIIRTLFIGEDARGLGHIGVRRPGFGMGPISFSMVTGFVIVALIVFGNSIRIRLGGEKTLPNLAVIFGLTIVLTLLFGALILTETVSNWGATTVAILVTFTMMFIFRPKDVSTKFRFFYWATPVAPILTGLTLVLINSNLIEARLASKNLNTTSFHTSTLAELPEKILGPRYDLYVIGLRSFLENPMIGVMPGGVADNIASAGPDWPHVHNLPLQILANFGFLGFSIFFVFAIFSVVEFLKSYRCGLINKDWAIFLFSIYTFVGFSTLFDFALKFHGTLALISFLAAIPMALQISRLRTN